MSSQNQPGEPGRPGDARDATGRDAETERVREVLARAMKFLARCSEDPRAALESDDPHELMLALEAIVAGPPPEADAKDEKADEAKPPIQIRRRKSA